MSTAERQRSQFATTRWSLVLALREQSTEESEKALVELCHRYWFPLYAYVRKSGYSHEDGEDLTQDFFAEFLEKGYFSRATPELGRFRNFMAKRRRRDQTQKRGGTAVRISWDAAGADRRYSRDLAEQVAPEILFDQQWGRALMDRVVAALDRDFARRSNAEIFQQIKRYLWGEEREVPYRELADRAHMSVSAFKSMVHRVRRKYRDMLRAEVAETVADPADIDDELRHLIMVLSAGTRA